MIKEPLLRMNLKRKKTELHQNGDKKSQPLLINIEVRFPIYRLFGGEVFLDGGQLTDIRNNISINDVKWGKGFGITFSSPFGPVRLDYSNKLEENNLKNGKLNLGLLYIF